MKDWLNPVRITIGGAVARLTNMVDVVGTTRYSYDSDGNVLSEDGPWANDTVSYTYENRLRTGLTLNSQPSALSLSYGYDTAKHLKSIGSTAGGFSYTLGGNSPASALIQSIMLPNGAAITNSYDSNARLLNTVLVNSEGAALNSHGYQYNVGNQRTKQTFVSTNFYNYAYDSIGQLKTSYGYEGSGTPRQNDRYTYSYDAAGNLMTRAYLGLTETFSVNSLNELTNAYRGARLYAAGATTTRATNVTMYQNGAGGYTSVLYGDSTFACNLVLAGALRDGSNTFTAVAKDAYGHIDTNVTTAFLPATNTFTYDQNGNLLSDGLRTFQWDAENQLTNVTVSNYWKSDFVYDGKMRRRIRREYTWQSASSTWQLTNEVRYVYDGYLVIQEQNSNNVPQVSYVRGTDLSGSLQGAGGIGGLLARIDHSTLNPQLSTAYYHADGNGNITRLINGNQAVVAKYHYDPFGNILAQSGSLAEANLYRFSSKELHANSGLVYYLYRYYDAGLQRWPNRDPLEEVAGINQFEFALNEPTDYFDADGRAPKSGPSNPRHPNPKRPPLKPKKNRPRKVPAGSSTCEADCWDNFDKDLGNIQKNLGTCVAVGFTYCRASKTGVACYLDTLVTCGDGIALEEVAAVASLAGCLSGCESCPKSKPPWKEDFPGIPMP